MLQRRYPFSRVPYSCQHRPARCCQLCTCQKASDHRAEESTNHLHSGGKQGKHCAGAYPQMGVSGVTETGVLSVVSPGDASPTLSVLLVHVFVPEMFFRSPISRSSNIRLGFACRLGGTPGFGGFTFFLLFTAQCLFSGKSLVRKYIVLHLFQNLGRTRRALFAAEGSGTEQRGGSAEDTCSFMARGAREHFDWGEEATPAPSPGPRFPLP